MIYNTAPLGVWYTNTIHMNPRHDETTKKGALFDYTEDKPRADILCT